jgi:hypothetical protein
MKLIIALRNFKNAHKLGSPTRTDKISEQFSLSNRKKKALRANFEIDFPVFHLLWGNF